MSLQPHDPYDTLRRSVGRLLAADRRRRARQRRANTLSDVHLGALIVLTQQPEATAGALAKEADLNPASVTAMIDQLEHRGLVERRRDTQDRRQCWVSLTVAGRKAVEDQERYYRRSVEDTFRGVTDGELDAAVKVIERITTVLERPRA
jgi:DNA-binding MarR family transcriptional regulator